MCHGWNRCNSSDVCDDKKPDTTLFSYISIHTTNSPDGLINLMDKVLHPVITIKARVWFLVKPEIFQVLFHLLRLFILLGRLCSLLYLYLQFKIWFILYISIFDSFHYFNSNLFYHLLEFLRRNLVFTATWHSFSPLHR